MRIAPILLLLIGANAAVFGQVQEIPMPGLPDIAMVQMTPMGPVIYYNPALCMQAGPALCGFYRNHEYGHIAMNHAYRFQMGLTPAQAEAEADCWAARNSGANELQAAYMWFASGGGSSWHHGSGPQRAARVVSCSGNAF